MSRYDGYDCTDLGCGPEFCDYPYCKQPPVVGAFSAKGNVKVTFLPVVEGFVSALPELDDGPLANMIMDADGSISVLAAAREPGCPVCQVPRTEPHLNDCAILLHVLQQARDAHLPIVHGAQMTIAGHPFYGASRVPPPEPPSLAGPDRGE